MGQPGQTALPRAVHAGRRLGSVAGDPRGNITRRIARFVTDELLSRADVVIDIPADHDACVLVRRFRADTRQGDVVMVIGQEVG